jgi:hypothetical protein
VPRENPRCQRVPPLYHMRNGSIANQTWTLKRQATGTRYFHCTTLTEPIWTTSTIMSMNVVAIMQMSHHDQLEFVEDIFYVSFLAKISRNIPVEKR